MHVRVVLFILVIAVQSVAQKTDSLFQVQYEEALSKLKGGNYSAASTQFTQLIKFS
jgi:outer membrane protein assembly factor BamD (BamD/ComL family)